MSATPVEMSGIIIPAYPIERNPGTGNTTSAIRPIATVRPESTTARPAVAIAITTASWFSCPCARSSRQRVTISSE